jgi:hypothetical protein
MLLWCVATLAGLWILALSIYPLDQLPQWAWFSGPTSQVVGIVLVATYALILMIWQPSHISRWTVTTYWLGAVVASVWDFWVYFENSRASPMPALCAAALCLFTFAFAREHSRSGTAPPSIPRTDGQHPLLRSEMVGEYVTRLKMAGLQESRFDAVVANLAADKMVSDAEVVGIAAQYIGVAEGLRSRNVALEAIRKRFFELVRYARQQELALYRQR